MDGGQRGKSGLNLPHRSPAPDGGAGQVFVTGAVVGSVAGFESGRHPLGDRGRRVGSRRTSAGASLGDGGPRSVFAGWSPVLFQTMGWDEQEESRARARGAHVG